MTSAVGYIRTLPGLAVREKGADCARTLNASVFELTDVFVSPTIVLDGDTALVSDSVRGPFLANFTDIVG